MFSFFFKKFFHNLKFIWKLNALIWNDILELASLHFVLTTKHFVCFLLKLSKLRYSWLLLSSSGFPLVYSKGFLTALCSWSSFVRIISPIRPKYFYVSLLAYLVNIPFNDLVQLCYPFVDSIAQWLEDLALSICSKNSTTQPQNQNQNPMNTKN